MASFYKYTLLALLALSILSCGDSPKKETEQPPEVIAEKKPELPAVLYVIAPSGLILRKSADLNSERIDKIPYGGKVDVLTNELTTTLEVANIPGAMLNIKYGDTTGYAFSGYLTQFMTPGNGENANQYAQRLKSDFPEVQFNTDNGVNNSGTRLVLTLPARDWAEAYLIAKQLFDLPTSFDFPGLKGPQKSVVKVAQARKNSPEASLTATRDKNSLVEINYTGGGKTYTTTVQLRKDGPLYKITQEVTQN